VHVKPLASNSELYEYLLGLEGTLRRHGSVDLADAVASASRQASGLSTEFLGEARITLRRVSTQVQGVLSEQDRRDLLDVLGQLDAALDRR
jgi:hypothetical protein